MHIWNICGENVEEQEMSAVNKRTRDRGAVVVAYDETVSKLCVGAIL